MSFTNTRIPPRFQNPTMVTRYSLTLPLPSTFRASDILAFHRRDPHEMAERLSESFLEKGMLWHEVPACLSVRFSLGQVQAHLTVDGGTQDGDEQQHFEAMVSRMLGLTQEIEAFEQHYADHPQLGGLIARKPGLRVPVAATPFEALT